METEKVTGKDLLLTLSKDVTDLCALVDLWLNNQNDMINRISLLEERMAQVEKHAGEQPI
jgi:hypothetical protein